MRSEGGAVLLVDDDPDALTILSNALEHHGYKTLLAVNAENGIDMLNREWEHIDCVVLDIMMPGKFNGYDVMKQLKESPLTANIPVLVLSAKTSPEDIANSYSHGAFQHLCKPCDISHLSSIIRNIVRLRKLERKSLSDARKYQAIIDNSPVLIAVVSPQMSILEMNRSFRSVFTKPAIGDNILDTCFSALGEDFSSHPIVKALESGDVHAANLPVMIDGTLRHLDGRAAPIYNSDDKIESVIYICVDASEQIEMQQKLRGQIERYNRVLQEQDRTTDYLIQAQKELQLKGMELERLSMTDPLTGLSNRRQFDDNLEREARRAGRYKHPLSLLMIDIDHFKAINDSYGHTVGDVILKELAKIFINILRETDTVSRYGGEEFAVILPESDSSIAVPIAERLRHSVEEHKFQTAAGMLQITISVGVASVSRQVINHQSLLESADKCLYESKNCGRNKVMGVDID